MNNRIDLIFFGSKEDLPEWSLGHVYQAVYDVVAVSSAIYKALENKADWIFFCDGLPDMPNAALIQTLAGQRIDAWHCGLKIGMKGLPSILNSVAPTWMYNVDAADSVEHTSFRLNFKCLLIRASLLSRLKDIIERFTSMEMAGLALGYAIIKSGGIIRYHPRLSKVTSMVLHAPSLGEEWRFARTFFSTKWLYWILLNRKYFFKNLQAFSDTRLISIRKLTPSLHTSHTTRLDARGRVSVLAPTLDRYEYLHNELVQLSKQTILPVEVLITDQTDKSRRKKIDIDLFPNLNIRCFPQEEKGQCIAWNKLLDEATGQYVLFLGDDADKITPDFIEKLLSTMQYFNCDMVASNVIEIGTDEKPINHHYYLSDTFPITLIKRSLLLETGFMDMFFNKNIRADHDLAMRCHLKGAFMIFDSSAIIHHHRAQKGGLRAHKARVVTNYMVRHSLTRFVVPTSSEIYLVKKYYNEEQYKNFIRIKFFNQLFVNGGVLNKMMKAIIFVFKYPSLHKQYRINRQQADEAVVRLKSNLTT